MPDDAARSAEQPDPRVSRGVRAYFYGVGWILVPEPPPRRMLARGKRWRRRLSDGRVFYTPDAGKAVQREPGEQL